MYQNATTDAANAALRARPALEAPVASAPAAGAGDTTAPSGVVVPPTATPDDPDEAPATRPPKSKTPPPTVKDADAAEGSDAAKDGDGGEVVVNGDATKK